MAHKPTKTFLIVGMAGTGKSTFSQALYTWISAKYPPIIDPQSCLNTNITAINLDPATLKVKMPLDLDIREYFDYENVMQTYNIGPNGAVTTIINLFLMRWDVKITGDFVIIDTPGQIEAFVWSNAGKVLVEKLEHCRSGISDERGDNSVSDTPANDGNDRLGSGTAGTNPNSVILLYLVDSMECRKPSVFMCNMVYALILRLRFNIPILIVFNKVDLSPVPVEWLTDYEKFMDDVNDDTMCNSLLGSMALYFEEYYRSFNYVGVSSVTGAGRDAFFERIERIVDESV
ncbi:GTPase XAB1, interacts with DNA repair protein XPA [Trachipleistophora hominis]|uniref:GPN-loop GTPase n=1 Tax=Trachipleistophora hominis TaxID=72359 RepID=L7JW70_TRAHO|nr:GTPase XAB1, interacts with DNA repair protein XPA [Trachipleistophora hominis]